MLFSDAIQEFNTEHEMFFLLTAYVEALGYCDKLSVLPWQMRDLPLAGADDIKARIFGLHLRLRGMTSDGDHAVRLSIEKTINVFRTALRRLVSLRAVDGLPHAA